MEFVSDTSFAVDCKARALYSEEVFLTYTASAGRDRCKFFEIFLSGARKSSEECGSYLEVMTGRRFAV